LIGRQIAKLCLGFVDLAKKIGEIGRLLDGPRAVKGGSKKGEVALCQKPDRYYAVIVHIHHNA
jgi:hypothetical protein